jgi:hypothetical protein
MAAECSLRSDAVHEKADRNQPAELGKADTARVHLEYCVRKWVTEKHPHRPELPRDRQETRPPEVDDSEAIWFIHQNVPSMKIRV